MKKALLCDHVHCHTQAYLLTAIISAPLCKGYAQPWTQKLTTLRVCCDGMIGNNRGMAVECIAQSHFT